MTTKRLFSPSFGLNIHDFVLACQNDPSALKIMVGDGMLSCWNKGDWMELFSIAGLSLLTGDMKSVTPTLPQDSKHILHFINGAQF